MVACSVTELPQKVHKIMLDNRLTKIPVYAQTIDNIIGLVHLRQLLLEPTTALGKLAQQVHFVPEQKTVESLIEFFRTSQTDQAIVVDEYGGVAGSVSIEDVAEELLGPVEPTDQIEPIEQIDPVKYRLAGNLAIHDWTDSFGVDLEETRVCTIGGFITALLGKIPRSGDVARLKNLKFTVERVWKHRIVTLILTLEGFASGDESQTASIDGEFGK